MFAISIISSFLLRENRDKALKRKKESLVKIELSKSIRRSINTLYIMGLANGFAMGFIAPIRVSI